MNEIVEYPMRNKILGVALIALLCAGVAVAMLSRPAVAQSEPSESAGSLSWPELPERLLESVEHEMASEWDFRGQLPYGQRLAAPGYVFENYGEQELWVHFVSRYGSGRVGHALPWLRELSTKYYTTPLGVAACFALLNFADASGVMLLAKEVETLGRSPEHRDVIWQVAAKTGFPAFAHKLNEAQKGGPDKGVDDTLRMYDRRPAAPWFYEAAKELSDEKILQQVIAGLDEKPGIPPRKK